MHKALFIYGTRPEAIKLAPVILECQRRGSLTPILCATAQHRSLLDEVNETFGLSPDYDLGLMRPDQTLPELTARAITAIAEVLSKAKPDVSIVQGDTTTALAGALGSFYQRVPVAHVEAGLRTYDLAAPFPEELNRQAIARVARWNFAPTEEARQNLLRENLPEAGIVVTGNTSIDALRIAAAEGRFRDVDPLVEVGLPRLSEGEHLILVTAHRRESFGAPFRDLCLALAAIAERWPTARIVYPVHPNPNVRRAVSEHLQGRPRIHLIEPVAYRLFVKLLQRAWLVLTDSGGIQEEAPGLGKPVLVLRDTTERPEAVAAGTARLVGTSPPIILNAVAELFEDPSRYQAMSTAANPFGDGFAARRVVDRLVDDLG